MLGNIPAKFKVCIYTKILRPQFIKNKFEREITTTTTTTTIIIIIIIIIIDHSD